MEGVFSYVSSVIELEYQNYWSSRLNLCFLQAIPNVPHRIASRMTAKSKPKNNIPLNSHLEGIENVEIPPVPTTGLYIHIKRN